MSKDNPSRYNRTRPVGITDIGAFISELGAIALLADNSRTLSLKIWDSEGYCVGIRKVAVTTTATLSSGLVWTTEADGAATWDPNWVGGEVTAISAGTIYALPVDDEDNLTATTGNALAVGQQIGRVPRGSTTGAEVEVVASALPSGASTAAKQDTGNTSLSSIDGKLPAALGASGGMKEEAMPWTSPGTRSNGTVAGNVATKVPASDTAARKGVLLSNLDGTYDLWVRLVADGAGAPTIDKTTAANFPNFEIPPKNALWIPAGTGFDVYAANSSGAATTSNYVAQEVL